MYVLSIDTATKSLAVSLTEYNLNLHNDLENSLEEHKRRESTSSTALEIIKRQIELLSKVNQLLADKIKIHYIDVIDLIPGKKVIETTVQERAKPLHKYLHNIVDPLINKIPDGEECVFLLENQMGPNTKSNVISSQIIYHLSKYDFPIELIGPTLKNKLIVGGADSSYSNFLETRNTNYAANKSHTRYCFNKFMEHFDPNKLKNSKIKKSNIDDIADSVLQGLAYVIKYKGF